MEVLRDIPQLALILLPRERERAGPKDLNGLDANSESALGSHGELLLDRQPLIA
jgi:hypothetical protein